jgi:hypothetical protein
VGALAFLAQSEFLGVEELGDGERVVQFDDVEVVGSEPGGFEGGARGAQGDVGSGDVPLGHAELARPDDRCPDDGPGQPGGTRTLRDMSTMLRLRRSWASIAAM